MAEIASEMLRTRERIAELDSRLEELLAENPAARIVLPMPGMGVVENKNHREFIVPCYNYRQKQPTRGCKRKEVAHQRLKCAVVRVAHASSISLQHQYDQGG